MGVLRSAIIYTPERGADTMNYIGGSPIGFIKGDTRSLGNGSAEDVQIVDPFLVIFAACSCHHFGRV